MIDDRLAADIVQPLVGMSLSGLRRRDSRPQIVAAGRSVTCPVTTLFGLFWMARWFESASTEGDACWLMRPRSSTTRSAPTTPT
jgi:hypothetical protein